MVLTLYSTLMRHIGSAVSSSGHSSQEREKEVLEKVQQKARKIKKGLELQWNLTVGLGLTIGILDWIFYL